VSIFYRSIIFGTLLVSSLINITIESMSKFSKKYTKQLKIPKKLGFKHAELMVFLPFLKKEDVPRVNPELFCKACDIEPTNPQKMLIKTCIKLDKKQLEASDAWLKYFIKYETDIDSREQLIALNKLVEEALNKKYFTLKEKE
jgi:hypothetical protein